MERDNTPCPRCGHPITVGFFSPDHCNKCGWVEYIENDYAVREAFYDYLEQEQGCKHLNTDYDENGILCCMDCGHRLGNF